MALIKVSDRISMAMRSETSQNNVRVASKDPRLDTKIDYKAAFVMMPINVYFEDIYFLGIR